MRTKRIDEIELYIREKKSVSLDTLCEVFNVSKNTVRRDIATLEQSGKIKKVYGGVKIADTPASKTLLPYSKRHQSFMKERKILPLVLSMSLPMVISMAVNALYNIVDSYFVAKLSEEAMTALALVYPIQKLITHRCWYWNRDQCRHRFLSGRKKTDHSKSDSNAGHCLKCFAWNIADSPVYSRSVEVFERIFR